MNIIFVFYFAVGLILLLSRAKIIHGNYLKLPALFLLGITRHNIYTDILFIIIFLISIGWKPRLMIIGSEFQILGISKDIIFNVIENISNNNGYIIDKKSPNYEMAVSKNSITINIFLGFTIFDNTFLAIYSNKRKSKEFEEFLNLIYSYFNKIDIKPYKTGVAFILISIAAIFVHYYVL